MTEKPIKPDEKSVEKPTKDTPNPPRSSKLPSVAGQSGFAQ